MIKQIIAYLCVVMCLFSCSQPEQKVKVAATDVHSNRLAYENSPYLLQHANNPVDWYPWGEEALQKAKTLNKPILISIGYAACHWCHVMEKESFEDEEVAKYMNEHFINIKVDREERPDIDQVYMDAAQMLTGSGGWPLNVIALPDGKPFFAGTYFDKEGWQKVLKRIDELYKTDHPKLESIAEQLTKGIKEVDLAGVILADKKEFEQEPVKEAIEGWKKQFDERHGGSKRVPKFPMPASYQSLLAYYHFSQDMTVLGHVKNTLDEMMQGGIYDQVGGGFSRYSTDREWKVPHFEKMLYDNAQLVSLYAQAYKVTKKTAYRRVVEETLAFVSREMEHKQGGFYASIDADSEGEEGKFYTWTTAEIKSLLGNDATAFIAFFGVKEKGNWEGIDNILYASGDIKVLAKLLKSSESVALERLTAWKKVLLKARSKRIRPLTDDKSLTAWNGLMISAYVEASQALGEPKYLKTALGAGKFIKERMMGADYSLRRNYKDGKVGIDGFLDDYAFTIQAFIDLYEATFDTAWLSDAKGLLSYAQKHFYNQNTGYFHYASDLDFKLIVRKMELTDNVIPSSNAAMAKNIFLLGHYFSEPNYWKDSRRMLAGMEELMQESPSFYANWWELYLYEAYPFYEMAIVGNDAAKLRAEVAGLYLPHKIIVGDKSGTSLSLLQDKLRAGQTTIYVCQEGSCKKPVTVLSEAIGQLKVK